MLIEKISLYSVRCDVSRSSLGFYFIGVHVRRSEGASSRSGGDGKIVEAISSSDSLKKTWPYLQTGERIKALDEPETGCVQ